MTRDYAPEERKANPFVTLVGWLFVCAVIAAVALAFCAPRPAHARLRLTFGTARNAPSTYGGESNERVRPDAHEATSGASVSVDRTSASCGSEPFGAFSQSLRPPCRPSPGSTSNYRPSGLPIVGSSNGYLSMIEPQTLIEPSGLALRLAANGSPCRTPGAVKARAKNGSLAPDFKTERGGILWTEESAAREVRSEMVRLTISEDLRRMGYSPQQVARILFPPMPKQLRLQMAAA